MVPLGNALSVVALARHAGRDTRDLGDLGIIAITRNTSQRPFGVKRIIGIKHAPR